MELCRDVERLDDFLDPLSQSKGIYLKASQRASVVKTRTEILCRLNDLIEKRRQRQQEEGGALLVAKVIHSLQDVLGELKVAQDLRTAVIQTLLSKLEQEENK
jgi:hypothetical protein